MERGGNTATCAGLTQKNVQAAGPACDLKQKGFYERSLIVPISLCSAKIAASNGAKYLILKHYLRTLYSPLLNLHYTCKVRIYGLEKIKTKKLSIQPPCCSPTTHVMI